MEEDNLLYGTANFILTQFHLKFPRVTSKVTQYYGVKTDKNYQESVGNWINENKRVKEFLNLHGYERANHNQLYDLQCAIEFEKGNYKQKDKFKRLSLSKRYLTIFSLALGMENFEELCNNIEDNDVRLEQLQLLGHAKDFTFSTSVSIEDQMENDNFPNHPVPDFLCGIYEGFFVRPKEESEDYKEVFTKFFALIKKDNTVEVKTTDTGDTFYSTRIEYFKIPLPALRIRFKVEKERSYEFQFNLSIPSPVIVQNFNRKHKCLTGVHGGENPKTQGPIAGRMVLRQIMSYKEMPVALRNNLTFENDYFKDKRNKENFTPHDFVDQTELSKFLSSQDNKALLQKLIDNRYIENTRFLEDLANSAILSFEGDYAIYYLASDELHINKAILRIDKFGHLSIKGHPIGKSENIIYTGHAYSIEDDYLILNMEQKDGAPYFFQYILRAVPNAEVFSEKNAPIYYQGVRTSISIATGKPLCGRVILKKYPDKQYSKKNFARIPIFPLKYTANGEVVYDMKISEEFRDLNKTYNAHYNGVEYGLGDFLTGNTNNLIKGFWNMRHLFNRNENYGELYFASACHYGEYGNPSDSRKTKFLENLYKARMHGFMGNEKVQNLKAIMESDWYKDLKIKDGEIIIASDSFFYISKYDKEAYKHSK